MDKIWRFTVEKDEKGISFDKHLPQISILCCGKSAGRWAYTYLKHLPDACIGIILETSSSHKSLTFEHATNLCQCHGECLCTATRCLWPLAASLSKRLHCFWLASYPTPQLGLLLSEKPSTLDITKGNLFFFASMQAERSLSSMLF